MKSSNKALPQKQQVSNAASSITSLSSMTLNNSTQVEDLTNQIILFAIKNKRVQEKNALLGLEDLSLIEQLNAFDKVMKEKNVNSEIANQVYRNILKKEREKAQSSIEFLTNEIQEVEKENMNQSNVSMAPFDFQGSFGEDKRSFKQTKKDYTKGSSEFTKKISLPKISLDQVIELQKNQIVSHIENQRRSQQEVLPIQTPSFLMRESHESAFSSGNQNQKKKLPKLNLSEFIGYQSYDHQKNSIFTTQDSYRNGKLNDMNEKAIDSNRAVAFAYYTRRLILIAWRAFFNYKLENDNKRLCNKIANN